MIFHTYIRCIMLLFFFFQNFSFFFFQFFLTCNFLWSFHLYSLSCAPTKPPKNTLHKKINKNFIFQFLINLSLVPYITYVYTLHNAFILFFLFFFSIFFLIFLTCNFFVVFLPAIPDTFTC